MSQTKAQLIDPVDGTIVNADINASAAIAGSKISPDFGSQNIVTTGSVGIGIGSQTPSTPQKQLHIAHDSSPRIMLSNDTTGHATPNGTELLLDSSGNFEIFQRENLNVEFFTNGSQRMTINGSGNVGIGTATASQLLHLKSGAPAIQFEDTGANGSAISVIEDNDGLMKLRNDPGNAGTGSGITFEVDASEIMRIDSSGRLLLGTTTEGVANASKFTIATSEHCGVTIRSGAAHDGQIAFSDGTSGDDEFRGQIRYNHTSNFLAIATDATERMRIDSSGKVGIGTTNPAKQLVVMGTGNPTIRIQELASGTGKRLDLGVTDSGATGFIGANQSAGNLEFQTVNQARMNITSLGKVGIGTSSPDTLLHLSGADTAILRLENTDTSLTTNQIIGGVEFEKQDASGAGAGVVGGLRMYSGVDGITTYLTLSTAGSSTNNVEHLRLEDDGDLRLSSDNAATNYGFFDGWSGSTGQMQIGSDHGTTGTGTNVADIIFKTRGGEKVRIQHAGGISFNGDTATANALDDYEEGTFSPAFKAENNGSSATTNVSEAKYTKIGDVVTVIFYITLGAHASGTQGGTARISGLPFTNSARHSAISVGYYQHFNANQTWFGGTVQPSLNQILLRHLIGGSAGDGSNNMDYDNNLKVGSQIIITATYTIN